MENPMNKRVGYGFADPNPLTALSQRPKSSKLLTQHLLFFFFLVLLPVPLTPCSVLLPNSPMDAPLQALLAAISAFILLTVIFALFAFLLRTCRKPTTNTSTNTCTDSPKPQFISINYSSGDGATNTFQLEDSASFDPSLDRVSLAELASATQNFSPESIIGDGTFGFVYKAQLPSGTVAAVKRLSSDAILSQGLRQFQAEIMTLGRLQHPNLARILGFCASGRDRLLIYEYLEQGSLDSWLHDEDHDMNSSGTVLTWQVRLKIMKDVAAGLEFLHEECKPPIIHRDIKASNVLLDSEFRARIADFGLARHVDGSRSHVSTQAAGTMGYMAPELRAGIPATAKADVYSFGVLMLEIVSRRRPNWPIIEKEQENQEVNLVKWARRRIEEGREKEILDRRMEIKEEKEEKEVKLFLEIAGKCIEEDRRKRPSMKETVLLLDGL